MTDAPSAPAPPPSNASFAKLSDTLPPSTLPPPPNPDGVALGGPTSSSPAGAGATSAEGGPVPPPVAAGMLMNAHVDAILTEFEKQLGEQFQQLLFGAKSYVDKLVADFESALASGHQEIAAITDELRRGTVVGRLGSLEMAVASHAAPALAGAGDALHDAHGLLASWFAGIKDQFAKIVAGVAEEKKAAAAAAAGEAPAAPAPPPAPAPSPAAAQMAAMGIPQFQPPPRL